MELYKTIVSLALLSKISLSNALNDPHVYGLLLNIVIGCYTDIFWVRTNTWEDYAWPRCPKSVESYIRITLLAISPSGMAAITELIWNIKGRFIGYRWTRYAVRIILKVFRYFIKSECNSVSISFIFISVSGIFLDLYWIIPNEC